MSKYSDIKKRVVGQRGVADNKSGSGYSASGAYYDIKKKIKKPTKKSVKNTSEESVKTELTAKESK